MNKNFVRPVGIALSASILTAGCSPDVTSPEKVQDAISTGVEKYIDEFGCGTSEVLFEPMDDLNSRNPNNYRPAQVFRYEDSVVIGINSNPIPDEIEEIVQDRESYFESVGAHEASHACHSLEHNTSAPFLDRLPLDLGGGVTIVGVETGFSIIADIDGVVDTLNPLEEAAASIIADYLYPKSDHIFTSSYFHTSSMLLSMMEYQNVTVEELAHFHKNGQPFEFIARMYGVLPEALTQEDINYVLGHLGGAYNEDGLRN